VLASGGARGAYEVGAASVLLPALAARGERVSIVVGTSVGALNAAFLAAHADRPVDEVVDGALAAWRGIDFRDVLRPVIGVRTAVRLARYLVTAAVGNGRLDALLDPAPLAGTARKLIPFDRLARNVDAGLVTAGVAATSALTGTTVVFVATRGDVPGEDRARGIAYVKTERLASAHIRASAAIPAAFPPAHVADGEASGWYVDGSTRMSAATKPALALGAARLVIIGPAGGTPADEPEHAGGSEPPDAFAGIAHAIQGLLADPVGDDVRTMASTNELLLEMPGNRPARKDPTPYIFVAPRRRNELGKIARAVYREHFAGSALLHPRRDLTVLGGLIGAGRSDLHGELFSYLCFARELATRLIRTGRADAEDWLRREHDDGPWRLRRMPGEPPERRVAPARA
jgi:NTE family protein